MTTLIFVLVWVVLGLGLLFIALSGGPSGATQRLMSTSRAGRRVAVVLFALCVVLLGAVIPVAVVSAVSNRNDIPEANVSDLTASEENGRELFGLRCANCHTLAAANAIAAVGPNLDQLRPNKELVLDAIENGRSRGNGQMAGGLYTGQDAEDVAAFVAKAVGQSEPATDESGESGGESGESGESSGGESGESGESSGGESGESGESSGGESGESSGGDESSGS